MSDKSNKLEPVAWVCRHPDQDYDDELEWHSHTPAITPADAADGWTAEPLYTAPQLAAVEGLVELIYLYVDPMAIDPKHDATYLSALAQMESSHDQEA